MEYTLDGTGISIVRQVAAKIAAEKCCGCTQDEFLTQFPAIAGAVESWLLRGVTVSQEIVSGSKLPATADQLRYLTRLLEDYCDRDPARMDDYLQEAGCQSLSALTKSKASFIIERLLSDIQEEDAELAGAMFGD